MFLRPRGQNLLKPLRRSALSPFPSKNHIFDNSFKNILTKQYINYNVVLVKTEWDVAIEKEGNLKWSLKQEMAAMHRGKSQNGNLMLACPPKPWPRRMRSGLCGGYSSDLSLSWQSKPGRNRGKPTFLLKIDSKRMQLLCPERLATQMPAHIVSTFFEPFRPVSTKK